MNQQLAPVNEHAEEAEEKKTFSNPQKLQELPTMPMNDEEPYTKVPVTQVPVGDCVLLYNLRVPGTPRLFLLVDAGRLFRDVQSQLASGISAFEACVQARVAITRSKEEEEEEVCAVVDNEEKQRVVGKASHAMKTMTLTQDVWGLLVSERACPFASKFKTLLATIAVHDLAYQAATRCFQENEDLKRRFQHFIYDLLNLSQGEARLMFVDTSGEEEEGEAEDSQMASFYLSSVYFSAAEKEFIYYFPTAHGVPFYEFAAERLKDKKPRGRRGVFCSSHDLAPLFREVFPCDPGFHKARAFTQDHKHFAKEAAAKMKAAANKTVKSSSCSSSSSSSSPVGDERSAQIAELVLKLGQLRAMEDPKAQQTATRLEKEIKRLSKKG